MTASLRVIDPGVAATLQDSGREGYQRFGVPVSGALDRVSLAIANTLVGNAPHEAALEVLAAGLTVMVCADSVVLAVAGMADPFVVQTAQADVQSPPVSRHRGETRRHRAISSSEGRRRLLCCGCGRLRYSFRFRQQINLSTRSDWRLPRTGAKGRGRVAPSHARRVRSRSFFARCEPFRAGRLARDARAERRILQASALLKRC